MKKRGAPQLLAWSKSSQWRAISSAQAKKNLAALNAAPRCGALARSTGGPCRNPIKAGFNRCRLHGATPKGAKWHIAGPAITHVKTERKIRDRVRAAEKKARRLAKMAPEELEAHRQWQRAHQPGNAAARQRLRDERKQSAEVRAMMERPRPAPSAKSSELADQITALRAELDRRRDDEQKPKPIGAFA
ncbi:hypothetical protein [Mesorhizobium sp. M0296]|uniref:hypothetical protein n=1 Tax=Mesorhizobium sp. M0296 TaxID=2956931 RepID=UPI003339E230